jgi:2-succinyl-6-hydroxy-2,4-cyclohexadiene-1-carboxylate synthase
VSGIVIDGLRWEVRSRGTGRPLLLLHGFTGRGVAWGAHATAFARGFRVIAVDLPGHGRSGTATPERLTIERTADDLAEILDRLDAVPAGVIGYSLGARIALRLVVAHPRVVRRLVLESPSAGLATAAERIARRRADLELATSIEYDGIAAFVARWEAQPIFASQASLPAARAARLHAMRMANDPSGLAASLRGAGQGSMEPLFGYLEDVTAPTLVIAGALDDRGRPRAGEVARGIPGARLEIIDDAGHTPHEEQPSVFRRLALDFLQEDPAP